MSLKWYLFKRRMYNFWLSVKYLPDTIDEWRTIRRRRKEARRNPITDRRILITYEIITPESAEIGDAEESGWENEEGVDVSPDEWDIDDGITVVDKAVKFLREAGANQASSSHFHVGTWYTAYGEMDMDGNTTNYSYHLEGFLPEEEEAIFKMMDN